MIGDTLALFLALVLGSAAVHKLVARERLVLATERLLRIAPPVARVAMFGAAAVEAAATIALLLAPVRIPGAAIAALLWSGYAVTLAAARLRGESGIDCGCSFAVHRKGIDGFAIARNVVLLGLALFVGLIPASNTLPGAEAVFAALALFSLLLAAGELAALPSLRRSIAR